MLRPVRAEELDTLIDAFWPVALDLKHSAYPTYTDGVKTREDFAGAVRRAFLEDWGEVLVHVHDGADNGLLVIDVADDEFVSLHVCLTRAHQPECLGEALAYLHAKHAGKTLWLGFAPENAEMLTFAESQGFRLLWTDEDMYWNADRIEAALNRWMLFVMADGRGAVACMDEGVMLEIFGFQYAGGYDADAHRALMTACLNAAKAKGARYLTYFSDREEAAVMQQLSFRWVSDYRCYEMKL